MNKPKLTPAALDALLTGKRDVRHTHNPSRIIWTLPAIGQRIGVGADFVRDTIAKLPGSPIKEIGGRYYVFEEDLILFLRR